MYIMSKFMSKKVLVDKSRVREWCFVINNWTDDDYQAAINLSTEARYFVMGKEIGEKCGTPHLQGYVYFKDAKSFSKMKKLLPRANLGERYEDSSPLQASNYCKKDKEYYEVGILPEQGKRTDLNDVRDEILTGRKVDDIAIQQPVLYHQYGRTLHKIEDIRMRNVFRTEWTRGIWIYGPSGINKSGSIFKGFHPDTHYLWNLVNNWNDGYTQQPIVIVDDFRGEIKFSDLLKMCDFHPNFTVERRGRERLPFVSKVVYITSSLHPMEVYKNLSANDKWEQFYRRFQVFDLSIKRKFDNVLKKINKDHL